MPVTLPGQELHHALTGLRKVVAKRNTIPALSHVRLRADPDVGCTLAATDLDASLVHAFENPELPDSPIETLLPLDGLLRLVKSARRDRVSVTPLPEGDRAEILLDGP